MLGLGERKLLREALADNDTPTTGLQFAEITKITHASTSDCKSLEEYLLRELERGTPRVRVKILRVIKHVLAEGHHSFRADIRNLTEPIRACLNFRGTPDPLRGDAPYREVREAAQAVMTAVHDTSERPVATGSFTAPSGGSGSSGSGLSLGLFGAGSGSGSGSVGGGAGSSAPAGGSGGAFSPPAGHTPGVNPYGSVSNTPTASSQQHTVRNISSPTSGSASFGGPIVSNTSASNPYGSVSNAPVAAAGAGYRTVNIFGREVKVPTLEHLKGTVKKGLGLSTGSPTSSGGSIGVVTSSGGGSYVPGMSASWRGTGTNDGWGNESHHVAGSVGGGWGGSAGGGSGSYGGPAASASGAGAGSSGAGGTTPAGLGSAGMTVVPGEALPAVQHVQSNGELEKRMVDDITAPGGVRAAPPQAKMMEFMQRMQSMDGEIVVGLLLDKLSDDESVQTRVKSLIVMEAILKKSVPAAVALLCPERDLFVAIATESDNPQMRTNAEKLVARIDGIARGLVGSGGAAVGASSAGGFDQSYDSSSNDLLGGGAGAGDAGADGLLAGLDVHGGTAAPPAAAAAVPATVSGPTRLGNMFGGAPAAQPAQRSAPAASAPAAAAQSASMFDGLMLDNAGASSASAPSVSPAARPAAGTAGQTSLELELLGGAGSGSGAQSGSFDLLTPMPSGSGQTAQQLQQQQQQQQQQQARPVAVHPELAARGRTGSLTQQPMMLTPQQYAALYAQQQQQAQLAAAGAQFVVVPTPMGVPVAGVMPVGVMPYAAQPPMMGLAGMPQPMASTGTAAPAPAPRLSSKKKPNESNGGFDFVSGGNDSFDFVNQELHSMKSK